MKNFIDIVVRGSDVSMTCFAKICIVCYVEQKQVKKCKITTFRNESQKLTNSQ